MTPELTSLIGSLGFPIVAYLLLFFKLEKTMGMIQEAVNNNTLAIRELMIDKRGKGDE